MHLRRLTPTHRPSRTAAVTALGALVLVAGCGTRLSHNDIRSAAAGSGAAVVGDSSATSGSGADGSSSDAGSVGTGSGVGGSAASGSGAGSGISLPRGGSAGTASGSGSAGSGSSSSGTAAGSGGGAGSTGSNASFAALMGPQAPIFGGNAACKPATLSPVNIGNVSTLSGVLGQLFSPVVPALQTFVKSQNACGGLGGHPIKLFVGDDQDDPSTAVSVAQNEIQNNHVKAFLGDIQVLTVDAMVDVVAKAKIPMIGGDLTNNTWFTHPYIFPQGAPPQAISYGYLVAAKDYFHVKKVGDAYCLEVPQACKQIDTAFGELAPKFGLQAVSQIQISITAPSYTSQCLNAQRAGVEMMSLTVDAPTQNRWVNSCDQAGFHPKYAAYPLGVGNEGQFLGNKNLGNVYVPLNTFAWMANATPAEKYWQASIKRYNPGFTTGDAAGLGWTAGALAVAASAGLPSGDVTASDFLTGLYKIKGNNLGGLTAPLTFTPGKNPKIPYCLFAAISNSDDSGWNTPTSKAACTDVRAPSDPNK